jgi:hypothetical protein
MDHTSWLQDNAKPIALAVAIVAAQVWAGISIFDFLLAL